MTVGQKIETFDQLKKIAKQAEKDETSFDIRVVLTGCYSRKTVYSDLNCFNYIDESSTKMKDTLSKQSYWNDYFSKHTILFDGFN